MNEMWATLGAEAAWQVIDLATGDAIGEHEAVQLPIVSVAKVPITLAVYRLADRGLIDLTQPVTLHPDGRSAGTTGISAMHDPVTISLRDAAYLALTISDNAAGDALWDALPSGAAQEEIAALGLEEITLREPMRDLYDRVHEWETHGGADPFDGANTATPRALTNLLELVWTGTAASPASCAIIRDLMTRQVWNQRLAKAFPAINISVAGKTGTVLGLRHEIGVVTYPGTRHYLVAVLTNSISLEPDHRVDAAIGEAARRAILALRRRRSHPKRGEYANPF